MSSRAGLCCSAFRKRSLRGLVVRDDLFQCEVIGDYLHLCPSHYEGWSLVCQYTNQSLEEFISQMFPVTFEQPRVQTEEQQLS